MDRNSFLQVEKIRWLHTTTTHHPGDSDGHHRLPIISGPVGSKRIFNPQMDGRSPALSLRPSISITVDQQFHKCLRLFETFGLRVPAVFFFFFLYKRPMRPSSTLCVETFGRDLRDNNKADGPAHQPDLLLIRFFLAGPGDGQTFRVGKEKFKVARLLLSEFQFKTTVSKPDRKKRR